MGENVRDVRRRGAQIAYGARHRLVRGKARGVGSRSRRGHVVRAFRGGLGIGRDERREAALLLHLGEREARGGALGGLAGRRGEATQPGLLLLGVAELAMADGKQLQGARVVG